MNQILDTEFPMIKNAPMAKLTSWRVGGCAKLLYKPTSIAMLQSILQSDLTIPIYFLGLGSNILIRDAGIDGAVIYTLGGLSELSIDSDIIYAEAGVSCAKFARFCAKQNLKGAEFFAGIPGTMGGALRMNAGCFGSETWEWVEYVDVIDREGNITRKLPSNYTISYRSVNDCSSEWFVGAGFKFNKGNRQESLDTIKSLLAKRAATQPTGDHSSGSVFKNPEGDYAGRLIEACDLGGYEIGGASVSTKHANFIINNNKATSTDIEKLIKNVQASVLAKFNIKLVPEIHIIGAKADDE